MEQRNRCTGCTKRCRSCKTAAATQRTEIVSADAVQQDVLWWEDRPTDDPMPAVDNQSGDVTDGSVDYFDFDWGEMVHHDECTMEHALFHCASLCGSGCFACSRSADGDSGGNDGEVPDGSAGCGTDSSCVRNRPTQQDETDYEILPEN